MTLDTFIKYQVMPTVSQEEASELEQMLEEARKQGYANKLDSVLTRIVGIDENGDKILIKTATALFPKATLMESELFGQNEELFKKPLSVIGLIYTGKDFRKPEKYLVHVRSKKTFQGNEQVSAPYAGYCEYIVEGNLRKPQDAAVKEFREEVKRFSDLDPIFVQNEGEGLVLRDEPDMTLGMPVHYMKDYRTGEATLENPLLCFVNYVDLAYKNEYPEVSNLSELDKACRDTEDFEIMGTAWVPRNKILPLWEETDYANRTFSVSGDIFRGFERHIRKL